MRYMYVKSTHGHIHPGNEAWHKIQLDSVDTHTYKYNQLTSRTSMLAKKKKVEHNGRSKYGSGSMRFSNQKRPPVARSATIPVLEGTVLLVAMDMSRRANERITHRGNCSQGKRTTL